jgi:hypothetical protein
MKSKYSFRGLAVAVALQLGLMAGPNSQRLALSEDNGELVIWNVAEMEQVLAKLQISP